MSKANRFIIYVLLLFIWILIFWASENVIWLGDDYYYQFFFERDHTPLGLNNPRSIENIGDVFVSQYNHYFTYNGRTIAHVLVQIFCGLLGKTWFSIFNGFAYIVLILSVVYLVKSNFNSFKTWLSVIIIVFVIFMTKMTPSCQIGYIWIAILNILFIELFLNNKKYNNWYLPGLFILGFLSGNGHECYSVGIALGIIIYWIGNIKRFGLKRYVLAIGYGLGTLLLCISPATQERASGSVDAFQSLFFFIFSLRALYILFAVVLYQLLRKKISFHDLYTNNAFYWNVLIVCIIFNSIIGIFCNRQLFGIELMSMILILKVLPGNAFNKFWMCCLGVIVIVITWFNAERVYLQRIQEERIFTKYIESKDGNVYQDTWGTGLHEGWASYFWENSFHTCSFKRMIKREYSESPEITILPKFLEGKDSLNIGNYAYHFKYKPGKLLLIQSKESPKKFYVIRKFFGVIPYQTREMDFREPWYETPKWRAIVYDELNPIIYNKDVIIED